MISERRTYDDPILKEKWRRGRLSRLRMEAMKFQKTTPLARERWDSFISSIRLRGSEGVGQFRHSEEVFYRGKACDELVPRKDLQRFWSDFRFFHIKGSTSNQWRKLKNPWFPGPFRPKKRFFAQLAHSAGPTLISYLAEEASYRLEFLLSWDSMDQDLLEFIWADLLYHMDVEKAEHFDELDSFPFPFTQFISLFRVFPGGIRSLQSRDTT